MPAKKKQAPFKVTIRKRGVVIRSKPAFVYPEGYKLPPTTGVSFGNDSPELVEAIRKECAKRDRRLKRARAKFPPTGIYKGRGKNRRYVANPKFTEAMATKLHKLAFTAEQVRAELIAKGMK